MFSTKLIIAIVAVVFVIFVAVAGVKVFHHASPAATAKPAVVDPPTTGFQQNSTVDNSPGKGY